MRIPFHGGYNLDHAMAENLHKTHTHTHTHKTHDEHMLVGGKGAGYYTNKSSPYAVKLRLIVFCRE